MTLTFEILSVTDPDAPPLPGVGSRTVFETSGGTIGRLAGNTWVLPAVSVSGHHARISWQDGVFRIEDTSRYGLFINSREHPVSRGVSHPLASGDFVIIGPYKFGASIAQLAVATDDPFAILADQTNPPLRPATPIVATDVENLIPAQGARLAEEVDPLKALGLYPTPPGEMDRPRAEDLQRSGPLDQHYAPPVVRAPAEPAPVPSAPEVIPDDYDPLAASGPLLAYPASEAVSEASESSKPAPEAPPKLPPAPPMEVWPEAAVDVPIEVRPPWPSKELVTPAPESALSERPPPLPEAFIEPVSELPLNLEALLAAEPPVEPPAEVPSKEPSVPVATSSASSVGDAGLAELLAGAGLDNVTVTPDFARNLGQMLLVVMSGVIDVLRAREEVTDKFRVAQPRLRPSGNNPLKLSVDAHDALFNLFVKRNAAYLGPVEAFEEAFDELRYHQLAELEGMQTAFQSVIADLHPDRLEAQFDRQVTSASILPMLSKGVYWDLYSDMVQQIVADRDKSFRSLFVERFVQAYEEQFERLREQRKVEGN